MDTRTKILSAEAAAAVARNCARPLAVVTGYFDVMLASHAAELEGAREESGAATLLVLVSSPPRPVLPLRARAEMAAALRAVDYVVIADDGAGPDRILAALAPDRIVRAEAAHQQRCAQLVEHVQQRQAG